MGIALGRYRWSFGLFWPVCVGMLTVLGGMIYWLIPSWPVRDMLVPEDSQTRGGRIAHISDDGRIVKIGIVDAFDGRADLFGPGLRAVEATQLGLPIATWEITSGAYRPDLSRARNLDSFSKLFPRFQTLQVQFVRVNNVYALELLHLPTGKSQVFPKVRETRAGVYPRGKWLALTFADGNRSVVKILDLQTWDLHDLPESPGFHINDGPFVAVSEDGSTLVVIRQETDSEDTILQVWDFGSKQLLKKFPSPIPLDRCNADSVQLSSTGDRLMLSEEDGFFETLSVMDFKAGSIRVISQAIKGRGKWVWSADGRRLASVGSKAGLIEFNSQSDDRFVPSDVLLSLWDTDNGKLLQRGKIAEVVGHNLWFRRNPNLLMAAELSNLRAWDAGTGQHRWTTRVEGVSVVECGDRQPLLFSDDGKIAEVDLTDGSLRIVQKAQSPLRQSMKVSYRSLFSEHVGNPDPVNNPIAPLDYVSPDGTKILSGSRVDHEATFVEQILRWIFPAATGEKYRSWNVYDVASGSNFLRFRLPENEQLGNACFSKDGTTMAVAVDRGRSPFTRLTVWDLTRSRERWISISVPLGLLVMIALWRRWRTRRLRGGQDHAGVAAAEAEGVGGGRADAVGDGLVGDVK